MNKILGLSVTFCPSFIAIIPLTKEELHRIQNKSFIKCTDFCSKLVEKYVRVVQNMYKCIVTAVRSAVEVSDEFKVCLHKNHGGEQVDKQDQTGVPPGL